MIKYVVALSNGKKQKIVNRRRTIRDYNFVSFQIDNLDKYDGEEPRVKIHYYGKKPVGYLMVVILLVVLKDVMCLKHLN